MTKGNKYICIKDIYEGDKIYIKNKTELVFSMKNTSAEFQFSFYLNCNKKKIVCINLIELQNLISLEKWRENKLNIILNE